MQKSDTPTHVDKKLVNSQLII